MPVVLVGGFWVSLFCEWAAFMKILRTLKPVRLLFSFELARFWSIVCWRPFELLLDFDLALLADLDTWLPCVPLVLVRELLTGAVEVCGTVVRVDVYVFGILLVLTGVNTLHLF